VVEITYCTDFDAFRALGMYTVCTGILIYSQSVEFHVSMD